MGAAIVAGDNLDILVPVAAIQLVLDAEVRELHAAVAVGQVVLVRPVRDFPVRAIGPSVAVGTSAVVLLEKLLVLPTEVDFQHDSLNLAAAVADVPFDLPIGPEQVGIVLEFSLASDVGVEPLTVVRIAVSGVVIPLAPVGLEDAQAAFCQRVRTLASADLDAVDEPFVPQVVETALGVVESSSSRSSMTRNAPIVESMRLSSRLSSYRFSRSS